MPAYMAMAGRLLEMTKNRKLPNEGCRLLHIILLIKIVEYGKIFLLYSFPLTPGPLLSRRSIYEPEAARGEGINISIGFYRCEE
jgi:hypothetical protein